MPRSYAYNFDIVAHCSLWQCRQEYSGSSAPSLSLLALTAQGCTSGQSTAEENEHALKVHSYSVLLVTLWVLPQLSWAVTDNRYETEHRHKAYQKTPILGILLENIDEHMETVRIVIKQYMGFPSQSGHVSCITLLLRALTWRPTSWSKTTIFGARVKTCPVENRTQHKDTTFSFLTISALLKKCQWNQLLG